MTCVGSRCKDPCANNICGENANCFVRNHTPICKCPETYSGDPFVACTPVLKIATEKEQTIEPNQISEEKQTSEKIMTFDETTVAIFPNNIECESSLECSEDKACIDYQCKDPCNNFCGNEAECKPIYHTPICSCNVGFTGDPYTECLEFSDQGKIVINYTINSLKISFVAYKVYI